MLCSSIGIVSYKTKTIKVKNLLYLHQTAWAAEAIKHLEAILS